MALTPGTRLGSYEIVAPLGAGGMGEVYRAKDTRLGRAAAIKTLPPEFAQDADRRLRFEREAKTLASLNHPHIAQVYGLEDIPGTNGAPPSLALVMERGCSRRACACRRSRTSFTSGLTGASCSAVRSFRPSRNPSPSS